MRLVCTATEVLRVLWIREAAHRNLRIRDTQARMGAALSGVRLILFSANYVVQGQEVQRPEYNATGSNLDYETNLGGREVRPSSWMFRLLSNTDSG